MRLYLAGPLFTAAERDFNLVLARRLEKLGYRVFLPQRDVPPARGPHRTRRLYEGCLRGLRSSDVLVAVCDGATADDGTAGHNSHGVDNRSPRSSHPRDMSRAFVLVLLTAVALVVLSSSTPEAAAQPAASVDRPAAEISGGPWINSSPLTIQALRGRVVFVEFWTYG